MAPTHRQLLVANPAKPRLPDQVANSRTQYYSASAALAGGIRLVDAGTPINVLPVAVDSETLKQLVLVERAGGLTVPEAQIAARSAMSICAAGLRAPQPTHLPAAPHEHVIGLIDKLTAAIDPLEPAIS